MEIPVALPLPVAVLLVTSLCTRSIIMPRVLVLVAMLLLLRQLAAAERRTRVGNNQGSRMCTMFNSIDQLALLQLALVRAEEACRRLRSR